MASQKQIDANRRNAQRSTGPITEAGKAVAKFNALRHGMTAESAVLPYEDTLAYAMLREALVGHYAPANIAEELRRRRSQQLLAPPPSPSRRNLHHEARHSSAEAAQRPQPGPEPERRRCARRLLHRRQRQHAQPGALSRHHRTLLLPSRRN